MSIQENAIPSSLARLLIGLSQDIEKKEHFRRDPSLFLANSDLSGKEIDALLSRDPRQLSFTLGYQLGSVPMDESLIREIVRDEIQKAKKKKKPSKKKRDKGPKKKK